MSLLTLPIQMIASNYEYIAPGILSKTIYPDGSSRIIQKFTYSGLPSLIAEWSSAFNRYRYLNFNYNPDGNLTTVFPPNGVKKKIMVLMAV
ncbi:MAG: hypothetical protein V4525_04795 [Pseudomonadota bacterium]